MTSVLMRPAPVVATFHAAGASSGYQVFGWYVRWLAERIDRKVVVSKDALGLIQSYVPGEYDILFNGVEIDEIASTEPTPTEHPTIFFCGRHEERKGLAVLLDAFRTLPADVRLWVASDGPDSARLRAEHDGDERITWLGRISDAEKFARLRGADVFCAPSLRGESFGVVLIEAMSAGTAVVASGIDGYRNVATDGEDALLVPPGDGAALAAALGEVLDDPELAASLRVAGARRARDFAMHTLADEYVRIYRELIAERAAPVRPARWWRRLR
jgi:phosphatidylinositol alpha-mannosyltransferase